MKGLRNSVAAIALLAALAPATAADLYNGGSKDGPTAASFTGGSWYLGLGLGGSLTDTKVGIAGGPSVGDFSFAGVDADIVAGYDYKVANDWLVGLRGSIGIQDVKGSIFGITTNQTWEYEIGARTGYVVKNVGLVYVGGGWTWQHVGVNLTGQGTDLNGPDVIAGLEVDLSGFTGKPGLAFQMESKYTWFGNWNPGGVLTGFTSNEDQFTQKARILLRF